MDFCGVVHRTCDIAKEVKRYNINNLFTGLMESNALSNAWC